MFNKDYTYYKFEHVEFVTSYSPHEAIFVFKNGYIQLFNYQNRFLDKHIEGYFNVRQIVVLKNGDIAFVHDNYLSIYSFDEQKFIAIYKGISNYESNVLKLKLLI